MDRRRRSHDEVLEQPKSYDMVDAFKSNFKMHGRILKNLLDEMLIAHPKKFAGFEPVTDARAEETTFYFNTYKELAPDTNGLPGAISCEIGEKNYVLEAGSNSVDVLEKPLPREIASKTSGLIFYLQEFSTGQSCLRFESSLHKGFCLAWNRKKKLVLKPKHPTDETQAFYWLENN